MCFVTSPLPFYLAVILGRYFDKKSLHPCPERRNIFQRKNRALYAKHNEYSKL